MFYVLNLRYLIIYFIIYQKYSFYSPKVIHIAKRAQVRAFKLTINSTFNITLAAGKTGTHGTRNGKRNGLCWWAQIITKPKNQIHNEKYFPRKIANRYFPY